MGVQAVSTSTPRYTETGSGAGTFALAYRPQTNVEARSELGVKLHRVIESEAGTTAISGSLGWAHYFRRGTMANAGFVTLPGTAMIASGASVAADTALVSFGVSHRFANGLGLSVEGNGEFGRGTTNFAGKTRLTLNW